MSSRTSSIERDVLKKLVPPSPLTWSEFYALADGQSVELVRAGQSVFTAGAPRELVYLLKGEAIIRSGDGGETTLKAGSEKAKIPMDSAASGVSSVVARSALNVLRLNQAQLDSMTVSGDSSSIQVKDLDEMLDDTADWMTKLVQSAAFRQLPPSKIHALILRLQELPVRAGQTVMRQGELGDNYYIILRGECEVVRENTTGAKVTLARLSKGETFGEESLLSSAPRNATVEMITDGLLMSLPKRDFDELIRESLLQEIDSARTLEMVRNGAVLLDVRAFEEHKRGALPGSLNVPLFMLRIKVRDFDPGVPYICYCETERESVVAAFLLSAWGFDAYLLRGGLTAYDDSDPMFSPR